MVNTKDKLPGNMTLLPETPKAKLLEELLRSTGDKFIDYENEKVSFDDPQFKSILEACMRLGSDRTENQIFWAEDPRDGVLEPKDKLKQGMVAAITCKISDPMDFAEVRDLGGGSSGVMIGAPGCDGMSMQYVTSIAIPRIRPQKTRHGSLYDSFFRRSSRHRVRSAIMHSRYIEAPVRN